MRKLKEHVSKLTIGYDIHNISERFTNSQTLSMFELTSSTINSIAYFSNILTKSLLESISDKVSSFCNSTLKTTFIIEYVGGSLYEGEISIDFDTLLKLSMWYNNDLSIDDRNKHLEMVINGCFQNTFDEVSNNFNNEYGIYIPKNHLKPLANTCVSCGISFDGGSIFENFVKQGVDGVEYYQTHNNEILKIVESSYSAPYRFGKNICYFKTQMEIPKRRWYECTKCNTEQPFIQRT